MKLAQGEYVALEKVESLMCSHPFIAQIFIYGDSFQSYLIAIVVPDPIALAGRPPGGNQGRSPEHKYFEGAYEAWSERRPQRVSSFQLRMEFLNGLFVT